MTERETVLVLVQQNGDCGSLECSDCPFIKGECGPDYKNLKRGEQWLDEHPELSLQKTDPRRYEIAKAVMAAIITCPDSCTLSPIDTSRTAIKWADALIAELDKNE